MSGMTTTTSHGRRTASLAQISAELVCAKAVKRPPTEAADKYKLFDHINHAAPALGLCDRSLTVLKALMAFHPGQTLPAGGDIIVFPSNEKLIHYANGIPASTLRRHLAKLVNAGIIARRDSPNGKRYAKKGQGGTIEKAFGFDLSPLVARAEEFREIAICVQQEREERKALKEQFSLAHREISGMIATGRDSAATGDWDAIEAEYLATKSQISAKLPIAALDKLIREIAGLAHRAKRLLMDHVGEDGSSAKESQNERHIEPQNQIYLQEIDLGNQKKAAPPKQTAPQSRIPIPKFMTLDAVLSACPDVADYALTPLRTWHDFLTVADLIAKMLQISPHTWTEACKSIGRDRAAVVVAAILQMGATIESPGGYLNYLIQRERAGRFSLKPILTALRNNKITSADRKKSTAMTTHA